MIPSVDFQITPADISLQHELTRKAIGAVVGNSRSRIYRAVKTIISALVFLAIPILFLTSTSRQDKWPVMFMIAAPLVAVGVSAYLDNRRYLSLACAQGGDTVVLLEASGLTIRYGGISSTVALDAITSVTALAGHMAITWHGTSVFLIPLRAFPSAADASAWYSALSPATTIPPRA